MRYDHQKHLEMNGLSPETISGREAAFKAMGLKQESCYEEICWENQIIPLCSEPLEPEATSSNRFQVINVVRDRQTTLSDPKTTEETITAVQAVIHELKTKGIANLQEMYDGAQTPLSDTALYQAFEILIANNAGEGLGPYDTDSERRPLHENQSTMEIIPGEKFDEIKSICLACVKAENFSPNDFLNPERDKTRKPVMILLSKHSPNDVEKTSGQVFEALNIGFLQGQRSVVGYKGPSFSVGDSVTIFDLETPKPYVHSLCLPSGWDVFPPEEPKHQGQRDRNQKVEPQI
jgi:hypothetical protein